MRITACYISKNEEENIKLSLNSIKDVVDEIVVVDTGSTDSTVSIAKEYGAKIYNYKWDDNFSNPRNLALDKASGEWIIFLDADEYFDEKIKKNIRRVIQKCDPYVEVDGIMCKRINVNKDDYSIRATDFMLRIFRNSKTARYVGRIHENVHNNGERMKTYVAEEKELLIYHTGYSTEIVREKFERNLKLLEEDIRDGKETEMTYFYLADCYMCIDRYSDAIENLDKFLSTGYVTLGFNTKPYQLKAVALMKLEYPFIEVEEFLNNAIDKFPDFPEFYRLLADLYFNNSYFDKALSLFQRTLEMNERYNGVEVNPTFGMLYEIYFKLGKIYRYKNKLQIAMEYFIKSLNLNKHNKKSFNALIDIIKDEDPEDIVYFLNSIYNQTSEKDIEFLVMNLSERRLGKTFVYYASIWNKEFLKEDSSIIVSMICAGNYTVASKYFMNLYKEKWTYNYALNMVAACLMDKSYDCVYEVLEIVKPSFKRIIGSFMRINSEKFIEDDKYDFLELVKQGVLLKNNEFVEKIISLRNNFEDNIDENIGDLFYINELYLCAIEEYKNAIRNESYNNLGKLYCKIAIAYFRCFDYENSFKYFETSLENGYIHNEVKEYFVWLIEYGINELEVKRIIERYDL